MLYVTMRRRAGQIPPLLKEQHTMLGYLLFMGLLGGALLLWGIAVFRFDTPSDEDPLVEDE